MTAAALHVEPSIVTAAFVPIAALSIWWTVRRIRKKHIAGEGSDEASQIGSDRDHGVDLIAVGLFELAQRQRGLEHHPTVVGETPVTIFRPQVGAAAPVVVIAHGFAGSQQLMQPFAETLARNGYIAMTFDFLGHGRNPIPMRGDITEGQTITAALLDELDHVAACAQDLPESDGRVAVLGHSMASDIVVRFAAGEPGRSGDRRGVGVLAGRDCEPARAICWSLSARSSPRCCGTKGCVSSILRPVERRGRRDLWQFCGRHCAQARAGAGRRTYRRALQP